MARSQGYDRPVSEEELEKMPERISEHFDRMRDVLIEEGVRFDDADGNGDGDETA